MRIIVDGSSSKQALQRQSRRTVEAPPASGIVRNRNRPSSYSSSSCVGILSRARNTASWAMAVAATNRVSSTPGAPVNSRMVPMSVPSVRHRSSVVRLRPPTSMRRRVANRSPPCPSSAPISSPTSPLENEKELALPGVRSPTMCVPAAVPSVTHSSTPCVASLAAKQRRPRTTVDERGTSTCGTGNDTTARVPCTVPSLRHSSAPSKPYCRKTAIEPSR